MTENPHTTDLDPGIHIPSNITVDYDRNTMHVDGFRLEWMLAAPGPIVTANADPDNTMGTVTVSLFAEEITVRGIPTPGTARPHTGATHVRLWDSNYNLVGDIDEGWRPDEPLTFTLNRDHPIAARIRDHNPGSQTDYRITVDNGRNRIAGYLKEWEIRRTRLGDLIIARFVESY